MLFYRGRQRILDADGAPVPGALANFYASLTNNRQDTYQNSALSIAHQNPVPADDYGFLPPIYLDPALVYKVVITDRDGASLPDGTLDPANLSPFEGASAQDIGEIINGRTQPEILANVTPVNYASEFGRISRWGANQTGVSAIASVAAQVSYLTVTVDASVAISGNVTIPSNVKLEFIGEGGFVCADGVTVTINGLVAAPPARQIFTGTGTVLLDKDKNPDVWANWFAGTDIGAKINAAMLSAGGTGLITIRVAPGLYPYATKINASSKESIRITGSDTAINTANNRRPNLAWSGAAGSGVAVDFSACNGFELDHLTLTYTDATYDGNLIRVNTDGVFDPSHWKIHDCSISGTDTAQSAVRLIELAGALNGSIENNYFRYAVRGISPTATSNNVIRIAGNWFEKEFSAAQLQARGGSWVVESNTFEGKTPTPCTAFELAGELNGLSFVGNMCVDGATGAGILIDLSSAVCSSAKIEGNSLQGGLIAIKLRATSGESTGISIENNWIISTTGVDLAGSKNCRISGNRFQCTTPWTGTSPMRYVVENNEMNGTTTSGIPVANDANVLLAATLLEGSGLIFVYSVEDNASAIYSLNGTAATATEISDAATLFTNSSGSASSINIYANSGVYRLENKRGATRTVIVNSLMGR